MNPLLALDGMPTSRTMTHLAKDLPNHRPPKYSGNAGSSARNRSGAARLPAAIKRISPRAHTNHAPVLMADLPMGQTPGLILDLAPGLIPGRARAARDTFRRANLRNLLRSGL
ncbi:MAG: hypothetical protein QM665_06025 [Desulfovibrio sp.]